MTLPTGGKALRDALARARENAERGEWRMPEPPPPEGAATWLPFEWPPMADEGEDEAAPPGVEPGPAA